MPRFAFLRPSSVTPGSRLSCSGNAYLPAVVLACAVLAGCGGHVRKNLLVERTMTLPSGRFVGPVEVEVPADRIAGRDLEVRTQLVAACGPLLRVRYPDGEIGQVGADDRDWQDLLRRRALAAPVDAEPAETADDQPLDPANNDPGHWTLVETEQWSGQREFLRRRAGRCGQIAEYRDVYVTGYQDSNLVAVWAEVPQELADAVLTVQVYELIDDEAERDAEKARKRDLRKRREAQLRHQQQDQAPRPPMPPPKRETPPPAKAPGAQWVAGQWSYSPGQGKWVWVAGYWGQPANTPPAKGEHPGNAPVAGCTWSPGYWVWERGPGRWDWIPGHWNAPPPLAEERGEPPVPESSWIEGRWVAVGASFEWVSGYWGKPEPRSEKIPPPPYAGAKWHAGAWLRIDGKWVWSPGYYSQKNNPPPPRKAETPGPRPHPDAVWLAGFWRWDGRAYQWTPGHWESPPGEGYVWVADPPDPSTGQSISGRWKLIIDVDANLPVPR